MATPDESRKRTWRFRLNDATALEVSSPPRATEKQVRRRGRVSLIIGTLVATVMYAAVAFGADLKADLSAANGNQQNKDLGNVVGGDPYPFDVSIFFQGGPATVTSVTFDDDGSLPSFVSGVTGGTVTRASGNGESSTATSTISVVAPCTIGGFGGNDNAKLASSAVQYTVTAVNSGASTSDVGTSTAWVNIKGSVTSLGSNCVVTPPSDTTPPSISYVLDPAAPDGANGWYKSNVTLTWTVTEGESPSSLVKTGCVDQNITADQAATTYSCSATSAGGSAGPVDVTMKRDATLPNVSGAPTTSPNAAGWYKSNVTIHWTCSDAPSGLAAGCPTDSTISTEGTGLTASSGDVYDNAGNVTNATSIPAVKIDKTPPSVSCNAASFLLNEPGAQVLATIADQAGLSGPLNASEYGAADTSSAGLKSVSITGYDVAGNSATASCSYTVGYNFDGLYDPVNRPNTMNVSKAGQAIPLKWRLTDYSGNPVVNLTAASMVVGSLACSASLPSDLVEEYASGSSGFQNLGDGYYQFNWKTPSNYATSCKSIGLNLGEGFVRYGLANFNFKK